MPRFSKISLLVLAALLLCSLGAHSFAPESCCASQPTSESAAACALHSETERLELVQGCLICLLQQSDPQVGHAVSAAVPLVFLAVLPPPVLSSLVRSSRQLRPPICFS